MMPAMLKLSKNIRINILSAGLSLLVGAALMGIKFYLYRLTHSSAILSDALESIINVVASSFALTSVIIAAKPPDESHPYGHGKIEYFSAGFEGALIALAAVGIFITGVPRILHPGKLANLDFSLLLLFGVSLVNLLLGVGLIRAGKRTGSLTLMADGKHVLTDVYTSGGVLIGLFLAKLTGWYRLDGIIACLMGINILVSGWSLVSQAFSRLMDASDPELLKSLAGLLAANRRDSWIDIHQLRAWRSGNLIHVDFHLILPEDYSLQEAHQEVKILEKLISDHFEGQAGVLVHADPCEDSDCRICYRALCGIRSVDPAGTPSWTFESLILQGEDKKKQLREK